MGNADAVVIISLITKVNGKEDLVHIFLTDRRKYLSLIHIWTLPTICSV